MSRLPDRLPEINIDFELHHINHQGEKYTESELIIYLPYGTLTFTLDPKETEHFMFTIEQQLKKYKKLKKEKIKD